MYTKIAQKLRLRSFFIALVIVLIVFDSGDVPYFFLLLHRKTLSEALHLKQFSHTTPRYKIENVTSTDCL